jgi:hypothetical protein
MTMRCSSVQNKYGLEEQILLLLHVGFEVIDIAIRGSLFFNSLFCTCHVNTQS